MSKVQEVIKTIPESVTVVGVTKYSDIEVARGLIEAGVTHLGENRADGFLEKYHALGSEVTWHFIGSLQTRKVRDVIEHIDFLHSLDRITLAAEIQKRSSKKVKCFVQVNASGEASKHGMDPNGVIDFVLQLAQFDKIQVVGLMCMAPETEDEQAIRNCFSLLRRLQQKINSLNLEYAPCTELSMGMSGDYEIAIEEGATFVRLGRVLVRSD